MIFLAFCVNVVLVLHKKQEIMKKMKNAFFILLVSSLVCLALLNFFSFASSLYWALVIAYMLFGASLFMNELGAKFMKASFYLTLALYVLWGLSFIWPHLIYFHGSLLATAILFSVGLFINGLILGLNNASAEHEDEY